MGDYFRVMEQFDPTWFIETEEIEKHCKSFYIRANRCSSIYNDTFALKGWKTEEINGIEFELNSILVEKWKGKTYRLVIQRQKRMDGVQDF